MSRIVFFGTSEYSSPVVETLLGSGQHELVALITKPHLTHYPKLLAQKPTHIFTPTTLKKNESEELYQQLHALKPDIGLVADYGLMIPQRFIDLFPHSIINIHFSKLPHLRGASPVQYTILQGLAHAAYTFLELDAKSEPAMDSGDIIWQKEIPLQGNETTESLYRQLFSLAAQETETVLTGYINGSIVPQPQDHAQATFTTPTGTFERTSKVIMEDACITHTDRDEYIERAIRAFTPWPLAWTTLDELSQRIQKVNPSLQLRSGKNPHLRIQLLEAHWEGDTLQLDRVQVEGKRPVHWNDFVNGYFEENKK
jgi:methionyl-tRNA formyltransferase